jgi:hypothetical protein
MSEIPEKSSKAPNHTRPVTPKEINRLVKNYKDTMADDDTRSAWFSIYELMALISDNKGNGVRIYYGRHDKDHKLYPKRHNVILVATRDADNPENPSSENSHDLLDPNVNGVGANPASYKGMGLDMGPLCPPRCVPPGSNIIDPEK